MITPDELDIFKALIATFHARIEMMVLAFIHKHRRRPTIVLVDQAMQTQGWMAAFVDTKVLPPLEPGETVQEHPKLLELAEHGARAWALWTKLECDEVLITFRVVNVRTGEASVLIAPRTREQEVQLASMLVEQLAQQAEKN